jgi:hypothetical protein
VAATKMAFDVGEVLVEAADHVQHQGAVGDGLAKIGEGVGHGLELPAVVGDGQITLAEVAELGVEVQCAGLSVPEKLRLDGEPSRLSRATAPHHGLGEVGGDGAVETGADDAVHPRPIRGG